MYKNYKKLNKLKVLNVDSVLLMLEIPRENDKKELAAEQLFASLHGFGAVISAFIFGICMAIVYLKTDNIFVPILAHFLNNLFAEAIVLLDGNHILFTNDWLMCAMSVLAVVSFILISVFIVREMKILNNNNL